MRYLKTTMNTIIFISILSAFATCNGLNQKSVERKTENSAKVIIGDTVSDIGNNIDCILQDNNGYYWFASNGEGVFRYDGKSLIHITKKDGLCIDFVLNIQKDINGNLWFSTRDGVCCYNGTTFTN